jgi:hypothetical protein
MIYKSLYSDYEWETLKFGYGWGLWGMADSDGSTDKEEQIILVSYIDQLRRQVLCSEEPFIGKDMGLVTELTTDIITSFPYFIRAYDADKRPYDTGCMEIAEIVEKHKTEINSSVVEAYFESILYGMIKVAQASNGIDAAEKHHLEVIKNMLYKSHLFT